MLLLYQKALKKVTVLIQRLFSGKNSNEEKIQLTFK